MNIKKLNEELDRILNESLNEEDDKFNYMLLARLKQDCGYFLGNGKGYEPDLWAGNIEDQIAKMKEIYNKLPEKPEWLSLEDIDNYEKEMLALKNKKVESLNEAKNPEDKLNKIAQDVKKEIEKIYKDDKDLLEYFVVEPVIREDYYDDGSDFYGIEVRTELSYNDMLDLSTKLDSVLQKYDKDAYFDMDAGSTMIAAIDL